MDVSGIKKTNTIIIFIFLLILALHYGSYFLIPLAFAIFLAALILPFTDFLEKKLKLGKLISAVLSTLVVFIGLGLILFLLVHQLNLLLRDLIASQDSIIQFVNETQQKIATETNFSLTQQEEIINQSLTDILNVTQQYLTNFLTSIIDILLQFLILHIFLLLLLTNREKFVQFLMMYIPKERENETLDIIEKTSKVSHNYLWGRVKVMSILAIMYFITFTAYDLEYIGPLIFFGALITIVPYIGPFMSGLLPVLVMVIFSDSPTEILSFTIIIVIIQLIESYVLEPIIIGSEVQQSPLFVLIAVFLGGMIWGGAGLILFVPIFAILKILFDNSRELRPVGFLMGYETSKNKEGFFDKMKKKLKK